jgi:DNA gyrase subunit B
LAKKQSSRLQALASKLLPLSNKKLKRGQIEGLRDCQTTDVSKSELFLLEGESAAGSASRARNVNNQAILPLRGKGINVFRNTATKVLSNGEIKLILQALGCGFQSNCDLSTIRYGKVMILTDADPDGSHITALLISFFLVYLRPLVEAGMVYIIRGPLYSASKGKERIYAFTREELQEKIGSGAGWNVIRFKGWGECDPPILADIAMNPETRDSYAIRLTAETYAECEALMGGDSQVRKILLSEIQ